MTYLSYLAKRRNWLILRLRGALSIFSMYNYEFLCKELGVNRDIIDKADAGLTKLLHEVIRLKLSKQKQRLTRNTT
jgi:hypothetical protein